MIFIGIFDFDFTEGADYFSHHAICNVETKERIIKDMDFYFIELTKFNKVAKDLGNIMDKWIYFIKEAENLDIVPEDLDDEGLTEAYADANKNTWSKEELAAYDYAAMREQDEKGREQKAEQRGEQKGKEEAVIGLDRIGLDKEKIAEALNISIKWVIQIIENHKSRA